MSERFSNPVPYRLLCLLLFGLLAFAPVVPSLAAAAAAPPFRPANEQQAQRQALSLFFRCAFHPEYPEDGEPARLNRWEQEITVWIGGAPTAEDRQALDGFLKELGEKVSGLPNIRRVRRDTDAAVRIWYIPAYLMPHYLEGYVDGNYGFFRCSHPHDRIVSARIGLASDAVDQETRIHLMKEELTGALGLPGDHEVYSDSILYNPWTTVQELSDVDWRMLNLLYSPSLSCGMTEEEARGVLMKQ